MLHMSNKTAYFESNGFQHGLFLLSDGFLNRVLGQQVYNFTTRIALPVQRSEI